MKRGDIYWAHLKPRSGSEQQGRRPVLVVSHNGFNLIPTWRSIIVIPLTTSTKQAQRGPTAVSLSVGGLAVSGLAVGGKESIALCHQITTLDRSKLVKLISTLSPKQMQEVENGIKAALDFL